MPKSLYETITDEYTNSKSYREEKIEPRWRDNIQLVAPKYGVFATDPEWPDMRFDSTGTECSLLLADGMFGNLCGADSKWFRYVFVDDKLNQNKIANQLLEEMSLYMLQVFNRSTFYDVGPEFLQLGNVLTATMSVDPEPNEDRIICTVEHPRAVYIKTDARGMVNTVFIRKYLRADQAAEEFGEENLDDSIRRELSTGSMEEYEFIECVRPRVNWKPGSKLAKEWRYGVYIFRVGDEKKQFIVESGSKTFPKAVWRWALRGNEPYGWTPIDDTMPDIRTCNQMVRTMLLAANKMADPAQFFPEEGRAWSTDPGSRNYYRDPNRKPFKDDAAGYRLEGDLLVSFQDRVRKALKIDHFLMLLNRNEKMTAREVIERKREGLSVVAATVGKFETEALDRIHARFLQIEADAHRLPGYREGEVLPKELQGKELKVEYLGPIPQQQKLVALEQGILSAVETTVPIFQLWPNTLDKIKAQIIVDRIWRANGATEEAIRSDKEWTQIQADKAKQAAEADQAAMKQQAAGKIDPNVVPTPGSPAAQMVGG